MEVGLDAAQVFRQPGLAVGVGAGDELQVGVCLPPVDIEELRGLEVRAGQARLSELDHLSWYVRFRGSARWAGAARPGRCSGHAELDGGGPALEGGVDLGELVVGAGEADFESFDLTEPAFAFGFRDTGVEVVANLFQPGSLRGICP